MTIFVPDISHHQEDISIQGLIDAGAAALIARVGQGAGRQTNGQTYGTTRDRKWQRNMAEAKRLGLLLVPYWYIGNLISAEENARLAAEWVGDTSLPWMLDHEDASGSIGFYREVVAAFNRRGLRVVLSYIPGWYWAGAGQRASLAGLPPLVNSRYVTASGPPGLIYPGDTAAGWGGFGGNTVALLQFTNKAVMANKLIDCSAFKGTKAQLIALLGGNQEEDMPTAREVAVAVLDVDLGGGQTLAQMARDWAVGQDGVRTGGVLYALLGQVLAAAREDLDTETVLARLGEAVSNAITESVLPAIEQIRAALEEDNAAEAQAVANELYVRLAPAV